jgi:hypothetical protein
MMMNLRAKALVVALCVVLTAATASAAPKKRCVSPAAAARVLSAQPQPLSAADVPPATITNAGNIIVLQADPELLILSNPFDLTGHTIHYEPVLKNRYIYTIKTNPFDGTASETIALKDDAFAELGFKYFQFPFAGKLYDRCYVGSNGNITFGTGDTDPPDFDALVAGPPRIAPFFADLDPETAGTVFVNQTSDRMTISWLKVPEFFSHNQFDYGENTFQVVLYKNGGIDLVYSTEMTATEALVGILPGFGRSVFRGIDFSRQQALRAQSSFIENFHDYESVNLPLLMQALYKQIPDQFDFVTLFSNFELTPVPGAQAFTIVTQNDVQGIGDPSGSGKSIFRDNKKYGSAKSLQAITYFGNLHEYPANPNDPLPDTSTSLMQMLAHETAHRWLAYIKVLRDGQRTNALLGRDNVHWSFFFNSSGSFLEGNQIVQRSSNSFVTSIPFTGYSNLDLYLMGLIPADQVTDTYYVDAPSQFSPSYTFSPQSGPEANVRFRGTTVPVRIADVIAANGERKPDAISSKKDFRNLFVLITKKETPATEAETNYLDMVRAAWEPFFHKATGEKATITTSLK